jgi:acyl-CoA dehydrogenase
VPVPVSSYLMSEADREIQAAARVFVDELIPHEVEAELHDGELPAELLERHRRRVHELGFDAINMPKELGGGGFSAFQQVLVQEQVGRATNALGWVIHTPASWLPQVATDEQLERWVVPTIRGERRECYAITEEGAGSDVDAIEATALRDGDGYLLDGVKWHVTSFNHADHVFFQAKLPAGQLVGEEGDRMRFAYKWFRYERLMIAARALGAAERLIEEATAFAKQRHAYGRPILDYQAIQFMLADSLTELWAARLMTYRTAHGVDDGLDRKVQHAQCSMAKLYASEMAGRVADRAVQVFGGRGYMRENVAERFYRELRVDRIWEGTSEIQRAIVADQLAKRGVGR